MLKAKGGSMPGPEPLPGSSGGADIIDWNPMLADGDRYDFVPVELEVLQDFAERQASARLAELGVVGLELHRAKAAPEIGSIALPEEAQVTSEEQDQEDRGIAA